MEPPVLEVQDDNVLNISIPTDGLMGNIYIEYDSSAIEISSVKPSSRSDTVFLSDTAQPGRVVLAFVDPVSHSDENKVFTMTLGWKTDAEDVEVSCFYEIRDQWNRRLISGIQSSTINRLPRECALLQNYPNPCNPVTWIPFRLAEDSDVVIRIYNSTGRLIRTLDLGYRKAGFHTSVGKAAYWDGRSEDGEELGSDVYFYSIEAGAFTRVRKMMVLR
jgi:hypothetical protein